VWEIWESVGALPIDFYFIWGAHIFFSSTSLKGGSGVRGGWLHAVAHRQPITSVSILKNEAAKEGIDSTPLHLRVRHGQWCCSEEENSVDAMTMGGKTRGRGDVGDMWTSIENATWLHHFELGNEDQDAHVPLVVVFVGPQMWERMGVDSSPAIIDARQAVTGEKMRMWWWRRGRRTTRGVEPLCEERAMEQWPWGDIALSPQFNLETQHDGRSARNWMKRV
jgi:hypothetical protein